jgi:hypothetical protein
MRAEYGDDGASSLFKRVFLLVSAVQEMQVYTHKLPRYVVSAARQDWKSNSPYLGTLISGKPS